MHRVGVIPGDGIGPEVVAAAMQVVDASGAPVTWIPLKAGAACHEAHATALPGETVEQVQRLGVVLKGPMGVPLQTYPSPNQGLRSAVGAFVNIRSATHLPGPGAGRYPGLDLVIARDLTEDLSAGVAAQLVPGVAGVALKVVTRPAVERLARAVYQWAQDRGRRRVTITHLAPSQRTTDGIFLEVAMGVAAEFPALQIDEETIDPLCVHLLQDPTPYEVVLTSNIYGGILCGVASGLAGSVGLMPGVNLGDDVAIFEAGHGSAPKYTGADRANPIGLIMSAALLLEHLGMGTEARRIDEAVRATVAAGVATRDLGGDAGTRAFTEHVCANLSAPVGRA